MAGGESHATPVKKSSPPNFSHHVRREGSLLLWVTKSATTLDKKSFAPFLKKQDKPAKGEQLFLFLKEKNPEMGEGVKRRGGKTPEAGEGETREPPDEKGEGVEHTSAPSSPLPLPHSFDFPPCFDRREQSHNFLCSFLRANHGTWIVA